METLFEESLPVNFVTQRFPRSCLALLPNNHGLVISVGAPGMTLYEQQDLLLELDAIEALNLCGGNSSTLYYQGSSFTPTPLVERQVANALLFIPKS